MFRAHPKAAAEAADSGKPGAPEEEEQEEEEGEEVVVMVVGVVEEEGIMTINKWLKGKAMVGGGQSRLVGHMRNLSKVRFRGFGPA